MDHLYSVCVCVCLYVCVCMCVCELPICPFMLLLTDLKKCLLWYGYLQLS